LVSSLPCAAALALRELDSGPTRHFARVRQALGFELGMAAIYTLLFLPLLPVSCVLLPFLIGPPPALAAPRGRPEAI
jgi:hypothetical protein